MKAKSWRQALARTKQSTFGRIVSLLGASELTPEFWEELQAAFIQADLGIGFSEELLKDAERDAVREGFTQGAQIRELLRRALQDRLPAHEFSGQMPKPFVVFLIGVNGSGKTTSAAKLAFRYLALGKRCLFAAADTYRAAAAEQLESWAKKLGIDVVRGAPGSDPGAVVYSAIEAAIARKIDVLLVDTSGRMHTRHNLMAELKKLEVVAKKILPEAPHQVLLVLDSTTGQNGLNQASAFSEAVSVTGVILAKLDSSAKGGIAFRVQSELNLPILYAGQGESLEDLSEFDPDAFVDAILDSEVFAVKN